MDKKVKYWIELSDYDVETASAMLKTGRYLYVGFMCHQTIEKAFKAYYVRLCDGYSSPPFSHSLSYLAKQGDFWSAFSENQKDFIDMLEPLNIEARYPSHKERLMKSLTEKRCIEMIRKTKEMQLWIKERL